MGSGRWSSTDWASYSSTHIAGKSVDGIYSSRKIDDSLNPRNVKVRESRDSKDNPNSTAIIVALDVTGSMGSVLHSVASKGLNDFITYLYEKKPVTNPHLMIMGVGDVESDRSPLQVTQFEADIRIAEQLKKIYFEQGGGGNDYESYILPWYFAAKHTSIDCWEKRKKKGYLFTIGDEKITPQIGKHQINEFIGDTLQVDLNPKDLLAEVSKKYHVFHIMVEEGSYFRSCGEDVVKSWVKVLGQRAMRMKDHQDLSKILVSAIQVTEGVSKDDVVDSWDKKSQSIVSAAIKDLQPSEAVVRF